MEAMAERSVDGAVALAYARSGLSRRLICAANDAHRFPRQHVAHLIEPIASVARHAADVRAVEWN
jgi:hypothetical protein